MLRVIIKHTCYECDHYDISGECKLRNYGEMFHGGCDEYEDSHSFNECKTEDAFLIDLS